jgi:hypothetical protein
MKLQVCVGIPHTRHTLWGMHVDVGISPSSQKAWDSQGVGPTDITLQPSAHAQSVARCQTLAQGFFRRDPSIGRHNLDALTPPLVLLNPGG